MHFDLSFTILTALKKLAGRQPACAFSPCKNREILRRNCTSYFASVPKYLSERLPRDAYKRTSRKNSGSVERPLIYAKVELNGVREDKEGEREGKP